MAKTTTRGIELHVESDTPATFLQVGNLTSVPVPSPEKAEVDATDFDSDAMESLPGLPDFGSMEFSGNYNSTNAGQGLLLADANDADADVRTFRVDVTSLNKRFTFSAYVQRFRVNAGGVNQMVTFEGALRVTGTVAEGTISA